MKFIVDRTKWIRGKKEIETSALLMPYSGEMCCVGFYCKANGMKDDDILGVPVITGTDEFKKFIPNFVDWIIEDAYGRCTTTWARQIYETNDSSYLHDKDRERKLKELFAEKNIEVEFIN